MSLSKFYVYSSAVVMLAAFAMHSAPAAAMGLVPETSMLLIKEAENGGSMNLKNSEANPLLLYTTVVDLPDDTGTNLLVTQPVTRVEGNQTQHVRFVLQTDAPLTTEHLKRVIFEGIPQNTPGKNKVGFSIRQNLPVIIHPTNLPEVQNAWTLLTYKAKGKQLTLTNPSPYVVRFQPTVTTLPSNNTASMKQTYILPGKTLTVEMKKEISADSQVKIAPVSRYGVKVDDYIASLTH